MRTLLLFLLVISSLTAEAQFRNTDWDRSKVVIGDEAGNLDAFSRLRVSLPFNQFDAQFTYDMQPLLFDTVLSANGSIIYDATDSDVEVALDSASAGEETYMQSFEYFRYTPGNSQQVLITGAFDTDNDDVEKYVSYGDDKNGFKFAYVDGVPTFMLNSTTQNGSDTVAITEWNIDKLDKSGPSFIKEDFTKSFIWVLDFQALYMGRVRMGFDINGKVVYCHEFNHANTSEFSYISTANLPVRVGVKAITNNASGTLHFTCSTVITESGGADPLAFDFSATGTATAASGTYTHVLSIQPKDSIGRIQNRSKITLNAIELLVTGSSPVQYAVVLGDVITGTTTFTSAGDYSGVEYNTAGTTSGTYPVIISSGFVAATNRSKGSVAKSLRSKYPITLGAAGDKRPLGRISLVAKGIGGASAVTGVMNWSEIR